MLKLFPWEFGEKPLWVNPENGVMWFIDRDLTNWCKRETITDLPKLEAVVCYVCTKEGDEITPIERVLLSKDSNVLAAHTSIEAMCANIDWLRAALHFKTQ